MLIFVKTSFALNALTIKCFRNLFDLSMDLLAKKNNFDFYTSRLQLNKHLRDLMIIQTYNRKTSVAHTGGLTKKMASEIKQVKISDVQNYLSNINITSEFQNNKTVAWSVLKTVKIIQKLNKEFGLNIALPKNILVKNVERFDMLNLKNNYGFANLLPRKLSSKNEETTPAMSVIFNKNFPWEKIDEISDIDFYKYQNTTTDFFLESFFHEFSHIAHEGHLLNKFGINTGLEKLVSLTSKNNIQVYEEKYGNLVEDCICKDAKKSPLELVACDMTKRFIDNINRDFLLGNGNPYKGSPYQSFFSMRNQFQQPNFLNKLTNEFYNGKVKLLNN